MRPRRRPRPGNIPGTLLSLDPLFTRRLAAPVLASVLAVGAGAPGRAAPPEAAAPPGAALLTAADVLDRFTVHDTPVESYSVPVHVDARIHKLISMRFSMNGTAFYKRPGRLALDMRSAPANFRRLFGELGTPLTWHDTYDLHLVDVTRDGTHTVYHMAGVPKHPGDVKRFLLDLDSDVTAPLRGRWECMDGTMIAMSIFQQADGPYQLPKRADVDLTVAGFRIHAVLNYGDYALNVAVADALFTSTPSP